MREKTMSFLPYAKQWIEEDDIQAVLETLKSDFMTRGPKVAEFEKALCEYTGAKYAVVVANGTAALHLAVLALDVPEGLEGVTSTLTFAASANALCYGRLKPILADICPHTWNMTPEELKGRVTEKTKVIIPVHFAGRPVNIESISKLTKSRGIAVIEDAAHSFGSSYTDGSKVGSCSHSDMTILSFHPVKTIATGEGGAIMTNSNELYQKLVLLRGHGITKDPSLLKENHGPWYYEMQALGYNYFFTDFQAALGCSQLKKIGRIVRRRQEIFDTYTAAFERMEGVRLPAPVTSETCHHIYALRVDYEGLGMTRVEVMAKLKDRGIGTQVHYLPVHMHPFYRENFGYREGDFPVAEKHYRQALSIPLYPAMTDDDVSRVIDGVKGVLA